jgi:hypothetical protein
LPIQAQTVPSSFYLPTKKPKDDEIMHVKAVCFDLYGTSAVVQKAMSVTQASDFLVSRGYEVYHKHLGQLGTTFLSLTILNSVTNPAEQSSSRCWGDWASSLILKH